ncbi:SOS response-associated peptidase family protein [Trueperella pyogenes]|uniref:SOS response-associated peptidase family protein n=2 Tax=Trueperella pyogenes TaxID=1661 RepID=UPI00339D8D70
MCGRYATTMSRVDIQLEFRLDVVAESYDPAPNWNVAPKQDIPIVLERRALPGDQWLHDALPPPPPPRPQLLLRPARPTPCAP